MQYRAYIDNKNVTCKLELTITRQNDINGNEAQLKLNLFAQACSELFFFIWVAVSKCCFHDTYSRDNLHLTLFEKIGMFSCAAVTCS